MKILIADDDLTIRSILQAIVTEWGFQACLANDGEAAWDILQQDDPPHILLVDWEMPRLNGLQLSQRIRENITENPPYIILLTARSHVEDIVTGLDSGANDFISKPFNSIELKARINGAQRTIKLQLERLQSLADAQLAASVFTHALEGIVITDHRGIIIDANKAYTDITGYSHEESVGKHSRHIFFSNEELIWQSIYDQKQWQGDVNTTHKTGKEISLQLSISSVHNSASHTTHYIGLLFDITESKRQKEQLEYSANYDNLTKLANRRLFKGRLEQAMAKVRRGAKPLALVYLDLDGFKTVNDKFGHDQGDQLLVTLANQLQEVVRETDTVARIGGDEFVVLLTDLSQQDGCEITLWRLLAAATTTIELDGHQANVSASLGVSFFSQGNTFNVDELFKQADTAMYQAKDSGKNNFQFFEQRRLP